MSEWEIKKKAKVTSDCEVCCRTNIATQLDFFTYLKNYNRHIFTFIYKIKLPVLTCTV